MKETINVNIGSQAFTLDKDGYARLSTYLDDVSARIVDGREEIMADIETRIAEMFREWLSSPMMVVTLPMVERAHAAPAPLSVFERCLPRFALYSG